MRKSYLQDNQSAEDPTAIFEIPKRKRFHYLRNYEEIIFGLKSNEPVTFTTFLNVSLNLLSFLHFIPFRIEFQSFSQTNDILGSSQFPIAPALSQRPSYKLAQCRLRSRLFCGLFQTGAAVIGCWEMCLSFSELDSIGEKGTIAVILKLSSNISEVLSTLLTCWFFWFHQNVVLDMINALGSCSFIAVQNQTGSRKVKILMKGSSKRRQVCLCAVIVMASSFLLGFTSAHQKSVRHDLSDAIMSIIEWLLGSLCGSSSNKDAHFLSKNVNNYLRFALSCWLFLSYRVIMVFEFNIIIALVYEISLVGNNFAVFLSDATSVDEVTLRLHDLKTKMEKINDFCGNLLLLLFASTIANYAVLPARLRRRMVELPKYWYKSLYLTAHSLTWICASEFHRKIQVSLRKWVNTRKIDMELGQKDLVKLNLLAMEIEHDPVGISCHYFTLNYALLASMAGLLMTYAIVAWQV